MKRALFLVCSLFISGSLTDGIPGKCPKIETVKDFHPEKMTGKWYSTYDSGKITSCVNYEFEPVAPNFFLGHFFHAKQTVSLTPKSANNINDGFVISSKFNPAMDKRTMLVFATDYDTYAGVITCKEVGDAHFPHISFWSRDTKMTNERMNQLKEIMAKYNVDLSGLKAVDHSKCDY